MDQEAGDNGFHRTGQALKVRDPLIDRPRASLPQPWRYLGLVAAAAVLLVSVLGTVIVLNRAPSQRSIKPPSLWAWSHQSASDSKTPQEAFATDVQLTPCVGTSSDTGNGAPPQTATTTWLDAGRDYGLALIDVTCPDQARPYAIWLFSLGRDDQQRWIPQTGYSVSTRNSGSQGGTLVPSSSTAVSDVQEPSWLPLPPDSYIGLRLPGPTGLNPPASVAAWYSSSRTFVFGHIDDPATRPADATSIQMSGQIGWIAEENGMVIVTLPLTDGTTGFFAGTDTTSQVENLAALAFSHMDDVLPPLPH